MGIDTKKEEGFRSEIYKDSRGIKTVGQGFNIQDAVMRSMLPADVASGKRAITQAENNEAYNKRMALAQRDAKAYLGAQIYDALDKERQGVFNDLSYNMGLPTLSKFVQLKTATQGNNWTKAAQALLNSNYARQVPNRARRNAAILTGQGK